MTEHAHKLKDSCNVHCHCIKINGLNVTFGDEKILDDVNLHMHCGELTVLIGPNGFHTKARSNSRRRRPATSAT